MLGANEKKRSLRRVREWLRGIASPCQGEGRGFDPRLPLHITTIYSGFFIALF